ncbi:hypothetical protein M3P05_12005 [Sansalvadorimonas sp. 2012CJ34-2]|uniref:Uncharacterized protein n=1 Tax=Parendozoicomonas callyspongiae TaxID=2942213 RepID=A0ABT0PGY9_9GAMM|nr:hypothetical protein [Sansalvadorimonas sp. 2012CJ34-2]MCL6270649.1 hypothetical protein [Sansalvadorimonas sp. 2012CJ34-2]
MLPKKVLIVISGIMFAVAISVAKAGGGDGSSSVKARPKSLPADFESYFINLKLWKSEDVIDGSNRCQSPLTKNVQMELLQEILFECADETKKLLGRGLPAPPFPTVIPASPSLEISRKFDSLVSTSQSGISSQTSVSDNSDSDCMRGDFNSSSSCSSIDVRENDGVTSQDKGFETLLAQALDEKSTKPLLSRRNAMLEIPALDYSKIVQWGMQSSGTDHFVLPVSWDITTNGKLWQPDQNDVYGDFNKIIAPLTKNEFLQPSTNVYKEIEFVYGIVVRIFGWKMPEHSGAGRDTKPLAELLFHSTGVKNNKKNNPVWLNSLPASAAEPFAQIVQNNVLPLLSEYVQKFQPEFQFFLNNVHGKDLGETFALIPDNKKAKYIDCYFSEQGLTVAISSFYGNTAGDLGVSDANVVSTLQLEYDFAGGEGSNRALRCSGVHLSSHFTNTEKGRRSQRDRTRSKTNSSSQSLLNADRASMKRRLSRDQSSLLATSNKEQALPQDQFCAPVFSGLQADIDSSAETVRLMHFDNKLLAIRGVSVISADKQEQITDDFVESADIYSLHLLGLRSRDALETMRTDFQSWYKSKVLEHKKALSALKSGHPDFEAEVIKEVNLSNEIFAEIKRVSPKIIFHSGEISLQTYEGLQNLLSLYKDMNKRADLWYRKALDLYEKCKCQPMFTDQQVQQLVILFNSIVQEEKYFRGARSMLGSKARTLEREVQKVYRDAGLMFLARDYQFQALLYYHALITKLIELILTKGDFGTGEIPVLLGFLQQQVLKDDLPKVIKKIVSDLGYQGISADDIESLERLGELIISYFPASGGDVEVRRVMSVCLSGLRLNI